MSAADSVRFGVLLGSHRDAGQSDTDVLRRSVALARQADALGVDDVWITEHHFLDSVVSPSSMALAAYLLGATERITVGTAVTLLPLHSPVHTAEQAALLDQVSGGRFVLGVGRGQPLVEYDVIGGGVEHWRSGMTGALDHTLAALDGKVPGPEPLPLVPLPATPGGPPVYVAANSEDSVRLAAERGLPMLLYFDKDAATKALMIEDYRRFAGDATAPADHAFALYTYLTETADEARELMRERARAMLKGGNRDRMLIAMPDTRPSGAELEALTEEITDRLLAMHAVGDAETCVDRLVHNISVSGCHRVLCQVEPFGRTSAAPGVLDRLAREVFPAVRARLAGGSDAGR
ncbi:LLM class flavin-dependent oxidoreductase [Amycolatopsis sp. YIM 10]|uniref:LLM class flavin-dependent oxidoreductase n=1 Tax=Amycolatopsis sp. YIM 10 TaxID=2653857 RepID=UPI0012A90CD1|nr:LLM class flavin-dependent oxidoreductase [Amycolatopsis sp. YIM 10]QFU91021.1 Alkanal monooxygenase alpha chain [Amycolatopsis sp. YIM 10]